VQPATEAVERAAPGVDDIRIARAIEQDMHVDAAGKITFRINLEVSLKMRPPHPRHSRAIILTRRVRCPRVA
jgi:flavin-binding protein dodecin